MAEEQNLWKQAWDSIRESFERVYPGKGDATLERLWAEWDPMNRMDIMDLDALCTAIDIVLDMDPNERRDFLMKIADPLNALDAHDWSCDSDSGLSDETVAMLSDIFLELEGLNPVT